MGFGQEQPISGSGGRMCNTLGVDEKMSLV